MRISRKRKPQRGGTRRLQRGGAKINFAYTYLILTADQIAGQAAFIAYMQGHITKCNCKELGVPDAACRPEASPILRGNQFLILAIKYDAYSRVAGNITELNTPACQSKILGHAILGFDPRVSIVGIYGICAHRASTEDKAYGSVLMNVILAAMKVCKFPMAVTGSWLGINLENPNIKKLIHLYTSFGFKHPFVTRVDPYGNTLPIYFLILTNPTQEYVALESESYIYYNKSYDMLNNLQSLARDPEYVPKMTFKLDKSCILNLRLFPYLGTHGIQPIQDRASQREYAGSMKIYASDYDDGRVIYTLSNDITSSRQSPEISQGEEETASTPANKAYAFHSHPISMYLKYGVSIGPPSGPDYYFAVWQLLVDKERFQLVTTIEGIYILSASEEFVRTKLNSPQNIERVSAELLHNKDSYINGLNYPLEKRAYTWATHDETVDPTLVHRHVTDYLAFINRPELPLEVQFIPWNQLTKRTEIEIHYAFIYLNAFADTSDSDILFTMYRNVPFHDPAKYLRDTEDLKARAPTFAGAESDDL